MPTTTIPSRVVILLACGLLALALTACGNKEDKKVSTQVAAKVGSEEVSVHQINQVLSRANAAGATPQTIQAMRKEVLEKLIDQQLAVDQATELKLHRSPEVLAQLEAARREVLARAYVQQLASTMPKPSNEEIKKYYAEHPQLFSERRIFNLQEILIPASADTAVQEQVRSMVAAGKPMEEIAALLRSKDIKFGGGAATRPAEQIPLEVLAKVHPVKDGQTIILPSPQATTVLRVASSQSAPVTEANALPRISQFLSNQRSADLVAKTIKDLRAKTTIRYMGDFAQAAGALGAPVAGQPAPQPAAPASPSAPPAVTEPAAGVARTEVAPAADAKTRTAIEKGVAGMK